MVRSQDEAGYSIRQMAEAGGVGVETIRFYQRKGLMTVPAKGIGIRRYGDAALRRLQFIRQAQGAGFTLEEIRELLALDASEDRLRARALADARIAALDQQIERLVTAREALQRLARSCAEDGKGPCPILTAFDR